jgi:hypothetical protein
MIILPRQGYKFQHHDSKIVREPRLMVPGQAPLGAVRVDYTSSLANKLACFLLPVKSQVVDVATGVLLINWGSGKLVPSANGMAATATVPEVGPPFQAEGYHPIVTSNGIGTGAFTMVVFINLSSGTQQRFLFGQGDQNDDLCNVVMGSSVTVAGQLMLEMFAPGAEHYNYYAVNSLCTAGLAMYGFTRSASDVVSGYKNGVKYTATKIQSGGCCDPVCIYSPTQSLAVGGPPEGASAECVGDLIYMAAAWNRELSTQEMAELYRYPYQFLIPA